MSAELSKENVAPREPAAAIETKDEAPSQAPIAEAAVEPVKIEVPEATPHAPVVETALEPSKIEASENPTSEVARAPVVAPVVVPAPTSTEKKVDFVPEAEVAPETPIAKLFAALPAIIKEAEHNEMWGVELSGASHVPTSIVLEKFLRANLKDVPKARVQLTEALKWRKRVNPKKLLNETEFNHKKFGGLGYVTVYPKTESHAKEIVTWNIYGAVKDNKETFGNVEE